MALKQFNISTMTTVNKATQDFLNNHEAKEDYLLWETKFDPKGNNAFQNYNAYKTLSKGEIAILRRNFYLIYDDATFTSQYGAPLDQEDDNEDYRDKMTQSEDIYKNYLSSDIIDLSRPTQDHMRTIKKRTLTASQSRLKFINNLLDEILFWGIQAESFEVIKYSINYTAAVKHMNKIEGFKHFTIARFVLAFHTIMTYRNKDGLVEAPSTVWSALFTTSYKKIIKLLPIFTLKHKGINNYRSARYEVNEAIESRGYVKIKNEKAIASFKKITLTKYKFTVEERKTMREEAIASIDATVLGLLDVMHYSRKYVNSDLKMHNLPKKYKWVSTVASEGAFSLEDEDNKIYHWEILGAYYYAQIKSITEDGEYEDYKDFAEAYIKERVEEEIIDADGALLEL